MALVRNSKEGQSQRGITSRICLHMRHPLPPAKNPKTKGAKPNTPWISGVKRLQIRSQTDFRSAGVMKSLLKGQFLKSQYSKPDPNLLQNRQSLSVKLTALGA
jgi:hypothetical protein